MMGMVLDPAQTVPATHASDKCFAYSTHQMKGYVATLRQNRFLATFLYPQDTANCLSNLREIVRLIIFGQ